ncbi:uncharacterized protein K452DRAFT_291856 [Aplosporella prunicola CBS 121167]|uniref:Uncharacterized protein n=1 Tax=Aplosporella prunicola CBS 121167 TaxID=1176127 RepID=A0A6A6B1C7_9PEZI|nr:uncharacterized protein K452DRAFT_291856 [Aplosporella prunicola CBS 121167]KAF2137065.1 hypothetical protein K452DRAFT_291856 [Aplosporella prunicola CBS 121167]
MSSPPHTPTRRAMPQPESPSKAHSPDAEDQTWKRSSSESSELTAKDKVNHFAEN